MAMILACPECQEKIKAREEAAGRKVRCPHCGAAVPVPKATARPDDDEPRAARERVRSAGDRPSMPRNAGRTRHDDYGDDDDEDRRRPRRRRRDDEYAERPEKTKSNAGLVIALCAGAGVLLIGGGVMLFLLLGSSSGPRVDRQAELDMKIIGLAYHQHLDMFAKAPFKLEELQRVLNDPSALQRLRDGRVVFFWGVHVKHMTNGSSATILAHDKDAPRQGGIVLFGDGSVRTISVDEFQKTAKAGVPNNVPPVVPKQADTKADTKGSKGGEFVSESSAYSIKIPADATAPKETKTPGANGATNFLLQMEMPDKTAFQVMLARFPAKALSASPADVTINGVRDRVRASLNGTIRNESSGQRNGAPYRDVTMTVSGTGNAVIRIMLVNDDLYQLMVLGPAASRYQRDAISFFDSLVVRDTPKVPPVIGPQPIPKDDPDADNPNDFRKLLASGKYKQAAELLEKLAQRAPASVRSRMRADAALAWLKADDKDRALAAARSAAAEPPTSKSKLGKHRWNRALGEVFLACGQYPQAIEHLQRALENTTNTAARSECQKLLDEARAKNGM